jgi:hypothetical protein
VSVAGGAGIGAGPTAADEHGVTPGSHRCLQ